MAPHRTPHEEPVHDVLAAEEFALPAPDPELATRPVVLPDDPTGISEPHDVLAAEEFALPAASPPPVRATTESRPRWASALALALGLLWLGRRLRQN